MRPRALSVALVAAGALLVAGPARAVTLVDLTGAPEPQWQAWADAMHVPSVPGQVVVFASAAGVAANCSPLAAACVSTGLPTEIFIDPASTDRRGLRGLLYHELGHLWARTLTATQQLQFMRTWHRVPQRLTVQQAWWAGTDSENPERGWGPVEEWFAEGYRLCATYPRWGWHAAWGAWEMYGYPAGLVWQQGVPRVRQRWSLAAQRATCRLIRGHL